MMSRWRIGKGAGQVVRDGKPKESFAEFMDRPDITWPIVTATAKGTMERTMGVTKITC